MLSHPCRYCHHCQQIVWDNFWFNKYPYLRAWGCCSNALRPYIQQQTDSGNQRNQTSVCICNLNAFSSKIVFFSGLCVYVYTYTQMCILTATLCMFGPLCRGPTNHASKMFNKNYSCTKYVQTVGSFFSDQRQLLFAQHLFCNRVSHPERTQTMWDNTWFYARRFYAVQVLILFRASMYVPVSIRLCLEWVHTWNLKCLAAVGDWMSHIPYPALSVFGMHPYVKL